MGRRTAEKAKVICPPPSGVDIIIEPIVGIASKDLKTYVMVIETYMLWGIKIMKDKKANCFNVILALPIVFLSRGKILVNITGTTPHIFLKLLDH